ncbi:MAG TPA: mannosyltransferase, partial [Salinimicrobium sp.]|nr:mannosyltransferase [Salinimicrobium sp.]
LAILVFLFVIFLSFFRRNKSIPGLLTSMLFAITFYYFMATTVHPWYLAVPVILCVFTNYKFPLIWSFFVVLSYQAYSNEGFQENMWLLAIEYVCVFGFMSWEIFKNRQKGDARVEKFKEDF